MLVLARKLGERCIVQLPDGQTLEVIVLEIHGSKIRLGFEANECIRVHRSEVLQRAEQQLAETQS